MIKLLPYHTPIHSKWRKGWCYTMYNTKDGRLENGSCLHKRDIPNNAKIITRGTIYGNRYVIFESLPL